MIVGEPNRGKYESSSDDITGGYSRKKKIMIPEPEAKKMQTSLLPQVNMQPATLGRCVPRLGYNCRDGVAKWRKYSINTNWYILMIKRTG
jgi:hypothetical protein